jgi:hypothetical protein
VHTQTISITGGTPDDGEFKLTFNGQTTDGIAWNASDSTVASKLALLSNIDPADISVTGNLPGTPVVVTFTRDGAYADQDLTLMTVSMSTLNHGATAVVTKANSIRTAFVIAAGEQDNKRRETISALHTPPTARPEQPKRRKSGEGHAGRLRHGRGHDELVDLDWRELGRPGCCGRFSSTAKKDIEIGRDVCKPCYIERNRCGPRRSGNGVGKLAFERTCLIREHCQVVKNAKRFADSILSERYPFRLRRWTLGNQTKREKIVRKLRLAIKLEAHFNSIRISPIGDAHALDRQRFSTRLRCEYQSEHEN